MSFVAFNYYIPANIGKLNAVDFIMYTFGFGFSSL